MSDVRTYFLDCGHIVEDDHDVLGPNPQRVFCHRCDRFISPTVLECLDGLPGGESCEGEVMYRAALSPTGIPYPRCDKHWQYRMALQEDLNKRYPDTPNPPSDFDPSYAGESWDED